jgi:hypothetical protein
MILGMCIMATEPISTAYFINAFHQSMWLYVYIARQRLGKNVTAATNTGNNRRIVGRVVLYAVDVVSKQNRRLFIYLQNFLCLIVVQSEFLN